MNNQSAYFIITGASTGLGKSFTLSCAKRKINLILVALPNEGLSEFAEEIKNAYAVDVVFYEMDLTAIDAVTQLHNYVAGNYKIKGIINNAGVGGSLPFLESTVEYIDRIALLNVRATALLTRLFVPELIKNEISYILNIASIAAYSPLPYKTIYPASKAFIYSMSMGLRAELKHEGVRVCVVNPGGIATNKEVCERIEKLGILAKLGVLSTEKIADLSLKALFKGKAAIVPGFYNKINVFLMKIIPTSIRLLIAGRIFRKEFKK